MKEKLTNNLNLKIIAVLFSVGIWVISININDPYQSKTYTVTVQLQNMASMTGAGKYVEVLDGSDEISVNVRANRSVLDNFSAANIVATADLKEINENNQVPIKLSTTRVTGNKVESIRSDQTYISLKVENIRRVQKSIEIIIKNEPAEEYILGKANTEQNALKISGPESIVNMIDKAAVTFDLEGAMDDVSMLLPIELYDAEGRKITDNRLTSSIDEVQCVASILETKEIPLIFMVSGEPQSGYRWTGEIDGEPYQVRIAGKSNVLRNIDLLDIPEAIDLSNASSNVKSEIDLKKYLPEGVSFADSSFSGKVSVTAYIEKEVSKTVEVDGNRIQLINLPEGLEGEVVEIEDTLTITFVALETVMAQLNESEINGYLDIQEYMEGKGLEELEPGLYEIPVSFEIPQGIQTEELLIEVDITRAE